MIHAAPLARTPAGPLPFRPRLTGTPLPPYLNGDQKVSIYQIV
jgi:hypothetical protein